MGLRLARLSGVHYRDWGERAPPWSGIRSERISVGAVDVHALACDAAPEAAADAPLHLLVHPMAAGATFWLDVIKPLSQLGPVLAPDMPGAVLGETRPPDRRATRAGPGAAFLCALVGTIDVPRIVVHGWSYGGLVALLSAAQCPGRVARLVLTSPTLPVPLSPGQRLGWQTLGRFAVAVTPPLVRVTTGLAGRPLIAMKERRLLPGRGSPRLAAAGGDLSRVSLELRGLLAEQMGELRERPARLGHGAAAFASALDSMYVHPEAALAAMDRLDVPTLLCWGDRDPLVERGTLEAAVSRRPDWRLEVLESAGHLSPMEVPTRYVHIVEDWLRTHRPDDG